MPLAYPLSEVHCIFYSIILMGVAISSYNRVHSDRPRPALMYVPTDKIIKDGQA